MYKPITEAQNLTLGTGQVAVSSGWTPQEKIAKKLTKEDYAVIGNLYSATRGINILIRNLLANPYVCGLVLISATRADLNAPSNKCLADFFENGCQQGVSEVGKKCWVVNSEVKGYIDIEIPEYALSYLRKAIEIKQADNIDLGIELIKELNQKNNENIFKEPMIFATSKNECNRIDGEIFTQRIENKTIAQTWLHILHRIRNNGIIKSTGDNIRWQELINLVSIVTDEPEELYFPEPNFLSIDKKFFENYKSQMIDNLPYKEGVKYTYGQRLRSWFGQDQVTEVIKKLSKEIDSASAIMSLWDAGSGTPIDNIILLTEYNENYYVDGIARPDRLIGDSDHDHSGSPCLNHINVRIIDKQLILTATFRSNDMYSAWVANAMGLRELQKHIRDEINQRTDYNLTLGNLVIISQSAHIYEDTWETVDYLLKNQKKQLKIIEYNDRVGNFIIEYKNENILIQQLNKGEIVKEYQGKNPLKLIREISFYNPSIKPDHIGYLGIEIMKANMQKTEYKQDV